MKPGMNLWTVYGWRLPERVSEPVLSGLADMGLDAVELVVDEAHNSIDVLMQQQDEIKALLARYGLTVPSIASGLFWRYNLGSKDEATRRYAIALVKQMCQVAKAYGSRAILIVAGQQEPHTPFALTWNNAVRSIREAARAAEELGILVGIEHVGSNFLNSPGEMANFIADVDHPFVGCYLDLGNAMIVVNGYPENWCTALAGKIVAVHAKDWDKKRQEVVCCGQGDLRWNQVLPVLRESGYDGYLMVETPSETWSDIESGLGTARKSVEGLQRFIT